MSKRLKVGEFELIERYFAPLAAAAPGALGLTDDAALLAVEPGYRLVVTTDSIVRGFANGNELSVVPMRVRWRWICAG